MLTNGFQLAVGHPAAPDGCDLLYERLGNRCAVSVWQDRRFGVFGVSVRGRLEEDLSSAAPLENLAGFLDEMQLRLRVWDLSGLEGIVPPWGVALFARCHSRFAFRGCENAIVLNPATRPIDAFDRLLPCCPRQRSVADAILYAYTNQSQ